MADTFPLPFPIPFGVFNDKVKLYSKNSNVLHIREDKRRRKITTTDTFPLPFPIVFGYSEYEIEIKLSDKKEGVYKMTDKNNGALKIKNKAVC